MTRVRNVSLKKTPTDTGKTLTYMYKLAKIKSIYVEVL